MYEVLRFCKKRFPLNHNLQKHNCSPNSAAVAGAVVEETSVSCFDGFYSNCNLAPLWICNRFWFYSDREGWEVAGC